MPISTKAINKNYRLMPKTHPILNRIKWALIKYWSVPIRVSTGLRRLTQFDKLITISDNDNK